MNFEDKGKEEKMHDSKSLRMKRGWIKDPRIKKKNKEKEENWKFQLN